MDQKAFETLKQKYNSVLDIIRRQGVQLEHLHEDSGKLIIGGKAPSDAVKNQVWDEIKRTDPSYSDLRADITVDASIAPKAGTSDGAAHNAAEEQTYVVEAGDTLSKISKQFYGEASLYMNIFEANRDKIHDPNQIQPGMELRIPTSGKQAA